MFVYLGSKNNKKVQRVKILYLQFFVQGKLIEIT